MRKIFFSIAIMCYAFMVTASENHVINFPKGNESEVHPSSNYKNPNEFVAVKISDKIIPNGKSLSVLVITDGATETDVANILTTAGFTVTTTVQDDQYYGTPDPNNYNAVILLNGENYGNDMPTAGQTALVNFVSNGGGFIVFEWIAYEIENGRYQSMLDLVPITRVGGGSDPDNYTVVASHPVTNGITSFSLTQGYNEGNANSGTVLLTGTQSGDAVVAKEYGLGKIVGFASAGNYNGYQPFLEPNMQLLLVNSVNWVAGNILEAPENLVANLNNTTGQVDLSWDFAGASTFQYFIIYRDGAIIDIAVTNSYTEVVPYGNYDYYVTAVHDDGESSPSNTETVIFSNMSVNPESLDFGIVAIGESAKMQFTISNSGATDLIGSITTPTGYEVGIGKNIISYIVSAYSEEIFDVIFSPIAEQGYPGDIVITHNTAGGDQNISVYGEGDYIFSLPYSESFETGFAGWEQSTNDNFDWSRLSGPTASTNTGPSSAYDGSYYLYTEASDPGYPSKTFGLNGVFSFNNIANPFMTFWYHMYGLEMGELIVQLSTDAGVTWNNEWVLSGNQGNTWYQAEIDLSAYANEQDVIIRYWATTGTNFTSDIAIDQVELFNNLESPYNLNASLEPFTGITSLSWEFDGSKAFQSFNVYRNGNFIQNTTETSTSDNLPTYGNYNYEVKALYTEGESDPSNTSSVFWEYTNFGATPEFLEAELASGDSIAKTLTVFDIGGAGLNYNLSIDYESKSNIAISDVQNAIIERSGILYDPITLTSYNIVEESQITVTYTSPEEIVSTKYGNSKSDLAVGILGAESNTAYLQDVQSKVLATGKFTSATIINVSAITPTLAELQAFDAVLVWSDASFNNSTQLGNNLADYIDWGGGVVTAMFELSNYSSSHYLGGRWNNDNYNILSKSSYQTGTQTIGTVLIPDHPLMTGVNSFTGGSCYRPGTFVIPGDATLITEWTDSRPLIVTKSIGQAEHTELGMFPVSGDQSSNGWSTSTDGALIMANALEWCAGASGSGWLSVNPESGTIAGNGSADIDVLFNATGMEPGVYDATIIVSNSTKAEILVPVTLTVLHPVSIDLTAFLEGPFFSGQMTPLLNIFGYIPLNHPYSGDPWNYSGSESVISIPNSDVIDWVLVELRETDGDASTATSSTIIGQRAGFVLNDGSLVDLDGISPLVFSAVASQNIFAVVYHRNHLGIMSAFPLVNNAGVFTYDFTTGEDKVYGGAYGHKEVATGIWSMISGNAFPDNDIDNTDKVDVWLLEQGTAGYKNSDMNMNGQVDGTDRLIFWQTNVGQSTNIPE
jgi:hypothetical protein